MTTIYHNTSPWDNSRWNESLKIAGRRTDELGYADGQLTLCASGAMAEACNQHPPFSQLAMGGAGVQAGMARGAGNAPAGAVWNR